MMLIFPFGQKPSKFEYKGYLLISEKLGNNETRHQYTPINVIPVLTLKITLQKNHFLNPKINF